MSDLSHLIQTYGDGAVADVLEPLVRNRAYLESWRPFYHPVATVEAVDEVHLDENGNRRPFEATVLGERIVLARLDGEIVAMHGTCPHRSVALGEGWYNEAETAVVCRYHGFEWDETGRLCACPAIQAEGHDLPVGKDWRVETYPAVETAGLVWVSLDPDPAFPVIDVPEHDDPEYVTIPISVQRWQAGCGRMVEVALDNYHFAFTHQKSGLGDPSEPRAPKATTRTTDDGYLYIEYTIRQPTNLTVSSPEMIARRDFEDVRYQVWARPNATRLVKSSSIGTFVIVVGFCPVSVEPLETTFIRLVYRTFRKDDPASLWFDLEEEINAEDQLIAETMRPWELSTDLDAELQVYVDRPTVTYRRWMRNLGIHFL